METDKSDIHRLLWAVLVGTAVAVAMLLVMDHAGATRSFDTAIGPPLSSPVYVEVRASDRPSRVFLLREGATMGDLVAMQRLPVSEDADRSMRLRSGDSVTVLPSGHVSLGNMSGEKRLALGLTIPLNTAWIADLEAIPGIGPSLAGRLVTARVARGGFESFDEVGEVAGVGESTVAILKKYTAIE